MTTRVTKGGLVGLLAGVGLATVFPPIGAALVIASTVSGAGLGWALKEGAPEDQEPEEEEPEEGVEKAGKLLDEFDSWARRLQPGTDSPPATVGGDTAPARSESRRSSSASRPPGDAASSGKVASGRRTIEVSLYGRVAAAESLLKEGRFLEAIDRFRELKSYLLDITSSAGASDRQRVVDGLRLALHRLAGVLIENDSPAEAEELLKESLELAPDDRDTLLHLGRLQLMLSLPAKAEPYFSQAIEAHPTDPEPYRLLGDLYVEGGRVEAARALFRQAQEKTTESVVRIEMLERISGLDPKDPTPLVDLGRAQAEDGNWEEARRAFREALTRAPKDAYVQRRSGLASLRLGHGDEGAALLEGASDLKEDLEPLLELAHYNVAQLKDSQALPLLREWLSFDRSMQTMEPVERRVALRKKGLEGDQVDGRYGTLRIRALLDFAAVETRSGSVLEASAAAREALAYGGTSLGPDALAAAAALAAELERQGNPEEAAFWTAQTERLGGSLDKIRQERDTYEDFMRRFKYGIHDLVAEGGMARVYRGTDTRTGKPVAIKRMHDRFCTDQHAVAYFYREVRALEELSRPHPHPNIVEFIASGITESRFVFAMEFVDGPSLRDMIDRGDALSLPDLCRLLEGICSGLDRAHNSVRNIVHRDLKPENVLLTHEGIPKLTDFGIARVSSLFSASRRYYGNTQSFVGTSLYSAPEQYPDPYSGQVPVIDARADIYSLGCILYELLTTQPPFVASEPGAIGLMHQRRPLPGQSEVQPLLPPSARNPLAMERFTEEQRKEWDTIVMRCLELKPSRRYRTAAALKAELERLRGD